MPQSSKIDWPDAATLKRQFLEDVELQCISAGLAAPPMTRGTHWDLTSTGVSNSVTVLSANQQILDDDSNVLTATGDQLDEIRRSNGLPVVNASGGSGRLTCTCAGVGTIPNGLRFVAPNGMRGATITSYTTASGTNYVQVQMIDTGDDSNLSSGTVVRWEAPPPNLYTEATVTADFVGGTNAESDARKRDRILNRKQNPPGGGNWAQMREVTMNASGAVGASYVYPAAGGPSSAKIALLSSTEIGSRVLSSFGDVLAAVDAEFPKDMWKLKVDTITDQATDVAIYVDGPVWLADGPNAPSRVITSSSGTSFVLDTVSGTGTAQGAAVGDTIAYWSRTDFCFYTAAVVTATAVGARQVIITTGAWSGSGAGPVVNEYVCPAFDGIGDVGAAWVAAMKKLGPGEQLLTTDPRYEIVRRYPRPSATYPQSITSLQLSEVQLALDTITGVSYAYASATSPGTPATVADKPYCLVPRDFGVYPEP